MKIANYFIAGATALLLVSCGGGVSMEKVAELGDIDKDKLTNDQKREIIKLGIQANEWAIDNMEDVIANAGAEMLIYKLDLDELEKDEDFKGIVDDYKKSKQELEKAEKDLKKKFDKE